MSIRSMVTNYLDKIVDARFKRDTQGRLMFLPMGLRLGPPVPTPPSRSSAASACRRLMIVMFVVAIPVVAAFNGFYQLTGLAFLGFFAVCTAVGFATQLYPAWLLAIFLAPMSVFRIQPR